MNILIYFDQLIKKMADHTTKPASLLNTAPAPSLLKYGSTYSRLYQAAKESLESEYESTYTEVRTDDLIEIMRRATK